MPVSIVEAIVLFGWMERDPAVRYLREECFFDPPLTEDQATEIWQEKQHAVEALGQRDANAPTYLPLDLEEDHAAKRFMQHFSRLAAANMREVVKIDPMQL